MADAHVATAITPRTDVRMPVGTLRTLLASVIAGTAVVVWHLDAIHDDAAEAKNASQQTALDVVEIKSRLYDMGLDLDLVKRDVAAVAKDRCRCEELLLHKAAPSK